MRIAVTGADGFVGRELCTLLRTHAHDVLPLGRGAACMDLRNPDHTAWVDVLRGCDTLVHLAARAHVTRETAPDPLAEFRHVNVRGTSALVEAAAAAGVRRCVFVSSIGVLGNETSSRPFSEESLAAPVEPYAISKYEAELSLREAEVRTGLEVAIVRLPLVYGPGVKGNFLRLLRLVDSGLPLPLGSVRNLRSYVGLDNLCDFLGRCVVHPRARGEIFLLADGEDLSTPALIECLAAAMGRRAGLFAFPVPLLEKLTAMLGMGGEFRRLTSSLQVDASHARRALDWSPATPVRAGLAAMAAWYVGAKGQGRS